MPNPTAGSAAFWIKFRPLREAIVFSNLRNATWNVSLSPLPSEDKRFQTAAGDIRQHRVNNNDGEGDWVFYDRRFNLLRGADEDFLRFLCETVHPVVRPDTTEALEIVGLYNEQLRSDGWELVRSAEISGHPVFRAQQTAREAEIFNEPTGWPRVDRQTGELRLRLREASTEEQFQSVGHLCREALISVAQAAYDRRLYPPLDGTEPSSTDANPSSSRSGPELT